MKTGENREKAEENRENLDKETIFMVTVSASMFLPWKTA